MRLFSRNHEMDMCHGPLLGKILLFTVPIILSSILQLLYNAADIVVVGRYAGSTSLAAVGSTGSLINLTVNLLVGLSLGASVLVSQAFGAKNYQAVEDILHTSLTVSVVGGLLIGVLGFSLARPLLELMGSPEDVIDLATLYLKIYFLGMPFNMLYNFGASIMRAVGDTRRPLYFLTIAGLINIVLNLVFVIVFQMGVAGVAIATVISQLVSALFVVICLLRNDNCCHLDLRKLTIRPRIFWQLVRVGLPAGLQGTLFSLSNVIIQSSINSFDSIVMAGNAAASNIEGFVYVSMNALYQASMTFTGQNVGARQYERIGRICRLCLLLVTIVGLSLGNIAYFFGPSLLSIYDKDPQVIAYGMSRLRIISTTYFLCGLMDTMVGSLRGMGYSFVPMTVSLLGACVFRIIWIYTIFAVDRTLTMLYVSYPISWLLTFSAHLICYFIAKARTRRKFIAAEEKEVLCHEVES